MQVWSEVHNLVKIAALCSISISLLVICRNFVSSAMLTTSPQMQMSRMYVSIVVYNPHQDNPQDFLVVKAPRPSAFLSLFSCPSPTARRNANVAIVACDCYTESAALILH
jgi:hypothetical protein